MGGGGGGREWGSPEVHFTSEKDTRQKKQTKKTGGGIILFLELLHTGDWKARANEIWKTPEINLCSRNLGVKKSEKSENNSH